MYDTITMMTQEKIRERKMCLAMICTYSTLTYVNAITTSIGRRGCHLNIRKNGVNFVEAYLCVQRLKATSSRCSSQSFCCLLTEPDLKCLVCSGNLLYV